MTREKAIKRLRDLAAPSSDGFDYGELAGHAFTKAAMLRDEGMKLEVSTCVQTLVVTSPSFPCGARARPKFKPYRGPRAPVREHRGGW